MDNRHFHSLQTAMSTVPVASSYARQLVEAEQRVVGGNIKAAIKSVARKLKRPAGTVWNLLFRVPKEVSADLFFALEEAVERKVERQIKDLENELAAIRASRRRLNPRVVEDIETTIEGLRKALREEAS
ncbi:hypothetical protein [Enterovirga sp. CN4-39]|uniref:hypothetical protein n=1 Tax=Enterovirga sp. CN4-39 TaxID=3400910 RepID=UPI003C0FE703